MSEFRKPKFMNVVNVGNMDYDGSQLHHAFAYEQRGVLGPTISYFVGGCKVDTHLVDLEDSLAGDFIQSEHMAHFIIEIPEASIREAVVWQRFFIRQIARSLKLYVSHLELYINGDDIMIGDRKLSVSIATLSRFSGLIHVGINVRVGDGCPVAAIGITEFGVLDHPHYSGDEFEWAKAVAYTFAYEFDDITTATYKVIEVS